ncbi:hypothetical protein N0V90_005328 [Kalmusia sp. IMI 367209]|nr:hypothetical protein N0V90_005328 [Kalmusia sp. IMI 367209]
MALTHGWRAYTLNLASPWILLVIFMWSLALASAQSAPKTVRLDPVKNFCMRWWSQSVVKNNVLYIDSGVERFNDSGNLYDGINNYILTINLTKTWDWKAKPNETDGLSIDITSKDSTDLDTSTPIPDLYLGHLFHGPSNTSEIYRFGGTPFKESLQPDTSANSLWTYQPDDPSNPWSQHNISQALQPNHGAGAEAIDQALGFYLNGQTNKYGPDVYTPLEGMLVIDLVDFTFERISTSSMKRGFPRVGGTLEYVESVGSSGILVALGGQIQPSLDMRVAYRTQGELIDFNAVDVFDLDSYLKDPSSNGTWYEQATTGDVPPPRIDFCTTLISAPDNSSHHIYLFGGINPITEKGYDDVVILSLPSFTWTNAWIVSDAPRLGHTCYRAGKRQMISVGGNVTNLACDWQRKGVGLLELTTLEWGSVFMGEGDDNDFKVPNMFFWATNGTADGEATVGEPKQGWTEDGLRKVFRKSRSTLPSTWILSPEPKKSHVGTIAGCVGGIVGLGLIAVGSYFWHHKRTKGKSSPKLHSDDLLLSRDIHERKFHELQGINEKEPAEVPGLEIQELNAAEECVEADRDTAAAAVELPGTNTAAGGVLGMPIIRMPGDDLPELPEYTPGLKRPTSCGSRTSSEVAREV